MSDVLIPALVGALCGAGTTALVLWYAQWRRTQDLAERVVARLHPSVGLYLRRKVAEAGLDPGTVPNEADAAAQIEHYVTLADALLSHERRAMEMGDTQEIGLARTMRMESTDELAQAGQLPGAAPPDAGS